MPPKRKKKAEAQIARPLAPTRSPPGTPSAAAAALVRGDPRGRRRAARRLPRSARRPLAGPRRAAARQGRADALPARPLRGARQAADRRDRRARPLPRSDHRRAQPRTAATGRPTATTGSARCEASGRARSWRSSCPSPRSPTRSWRSTPRRRTTCARSRSRSSAWRATSPPRDSRPEKDYALEFEEAAFLTLGVCYEQNGRFAGGAYHALS